MWAGGAGQRTDTEGLPRLAGVKAHRAGVGESFVLVRKTFALSGFYHKLQLCVHAQSSVGL